MQRGLAVLIILTSQGKSTAWQKKEKKTKTIDFVEK
jgi:hypothetical protein